MNCGLSRIEQRPIREIWVREEHFSDWLVEPENLELLCDALGIETIQDPQREQRVGRYRSDIFGRMWDGTTAIIENQFGDTDHVHLGEIITYASGVDASTIVWIVEKIHEEHAQAVSWLNTNFDSKYFFLVKVGVYKIDDSRPAPMFTVVESPNGYVRAQRSRSANTDTVRYAFWEQFLQRAGNDAEMIKIFPGIKDRNPTGRTYISFTRGFNGYELVIRSYTKAELIDRVVLDIWTTDSELYGTFLENKDQIRDELGFELEWISKDGNKSSSVRCELPVKGDFDATFSIVAKRMKAMAVTFNKYAAGVQRA